MSTEISTFSPGADGGGQVLGGGAVHVFTADEHDLVIGVPGAGTLVGEAPGLGEGLTGGEAGVVRHGHVRDEAGVVAAVELAGCCTTGAVVEVADRVGVRLGSGVGVTGVGLGTGVSVAVAAICACTVRAAAVRMASASSGSSLFPRLHALTRIVKTRSHAYCSESKHVHVASL